MGKNNLPPHSRAQNGGKNEFAAAKASRNNRAPRDFKQAAGKKDRAPKMVLEKLTFQPRPDWHAADLPSLPAAVSTTLEDLPPSTYRVLDASAAELRHYAAELLEAENASFASNQSANSQARFMSTIMSSGTLEDKVSALTLAVQESPLHATRALEQLAGLARKKNRDQALLALAALKDLLAHGALLPKERKLRYFAKQPGLVAALAKGLVGQGNEEEDGQQEHEHQHKKKGKKDKKDKRHGGKSEVRQQPALRQWHSGDPLPGGVTEAHLVTWDYEDWLKHAYFSILQILEAWCNDEIEYARGRALTFVYELLKEKPEQEENLLRLLVNKLGDTSKKIASRASYLLLQLQVAHPVMKGVVIAAMEQDLLFRPGQSAHAKYYAVITLNQTILSMREEDVANKLLDIYFTLFLTLLKRKDLRAYESRKDLVRQQSKTQGGGGQAGKKASAKARQREEVNKAEDELNEKIIAQVLTGVNRAFPFAKTDDAAFESQLDTIFRVTHSSNFNTAIQALMLIQQISTAKHYAADRFYRTLYESLLDPRLRTSSKQVLYLNLLYRSLKIDPTKHRVLAFVKRLCQLVPHHDPSFACGILYLVSQLEKEVPAIRAMVTSPEVGEDEEEERFVDMPEEVDGEVNGETSKMNKQVGGVAAHGSKPDSVTKPPQWPNDVDPGDTTEEDPSVQELIPSPPVAHSRRTYDGRKRDPEHSHAERSCLWELLPSTLHFHPSVALFASRLLSGGETPPQPDPASHSLMHFLDRFAYRGQRLRTGAGGKETRGVSIMQPLSGGSAADVLVMPGGRGAVKGERPVNEVFGEDEGGYKDAREDEVFFQKYFRQKNMGRKKGKEKRKRRGKPGEEGSSADEDEIWEALVKSRPELEGDEEGDEDESDLDGLAEELDDEPGGGDSEVEGLEEFMRDNEGEQNEVLGGGLQAHDVDDGGASEGDGDEGFDFAALESGDDEGFVGSDEDLPSDVGVALGWDADAGEEEDGEGEDVEDEVGKKKRKKSDGKAKGKEKKGKAKAGDAEEGSRRTKKRKLKHLPTFASVEEYAKLLGEDEDEGM
ncbi:CBF/Mak21 family-domain-containing protein [Lineolata rhizophorae]|uniref:CBF/Mak21 family-domain-containing protein n=1 Tax=Lineolata rhizophorae TaxID=578093 RepID=A0A6A6P9V9_9PEZI|nr:CBF/Mak21 family-domain-containing protein [Lineolata rhizophorae]